MNLRNIANSVTRAVNPNTVITLRAFASYAISGAGKSTPTYATARTLSGQVQALTKKEIEHLDSMNISGCERAVYVNEQLQAYDRLQQTGGDYLYFEGVWWRVDALLEGWTNPAVGWSRAALTRQAGLPS